MQLRPPAAWIYASAIEIAGIIGEGTHMNSRVKLGPDQRRALLGGLLAASFFLIEAGVIEIILGLDQECRRTAGNLRLAPDPFTACMPEWQWLFLHSASRGFLWLINNSTPALLAGLIMGVVYAVVGAMSASLFKGRGLFIFLAVHLFLVAGIAGLGYLGRYIA